MKQTKSVQFNFIMNFILTISNIIFPLITFPYVSRVLLPEGTGKVTFATSIITYFTMVAMLGIPTYGIRACAKVRDDKEKLSRTVQEILIINMVMTVLTYVVFAVSLYTIPKFEANRAVLVVVSFTMILTVLGASWLYSGLEEYGYVTIASVIAKFIGLVLMFLFVHDREDYVIYGGITVITNVGSYLFNFIRLRKYIYLRPMGNYHFKQHLKPIGVFFAMTVATSIYTNLDIIMLGFFCGDADVGYYNASIKIKLIMVSLVTSLGVVLLPRLSYCIEKGLQEEFKDMTFKAINFVILVAVPLSVYFMLFAKECIYFLSGKAFAGSIIPMIVLMPTVFFIGMSHITGMQILVPTGKEKYILISSIAGGVVDAVINVILIPKMASTGAAIGTLVAEIVVLLVQVYFLRDFLGSIIRRVRLNYCLSAIIPALGLTVLVAHFLTIKSNFLILAITAIVFFGVYGGILILRKEPFVMEYGMPYLEKILGKFGKKDN